MPPFCLSILKNCLIWIFVLIFLCPPVLVLQLWKLFVIISAKILRPQLKPFESGDVMTISDRIYTKPLINIGLILKVDGKINLQHLRCHFYKTLLEPIDSRTGKRLHVNLLCFYKKFLGYPFKREVKLRDVDLQDLIYETKLHVGQTLSDFVNRFFYFPYEEGKPLWNLALLDDPLSTKGSLLLFRLHHSMGDGYSLIHLFEQLTAQIPTKELAPIFSESVWDKIQFYINTPSTMFEFAQGISKIPNPFSMSGMNTEVIYSFFSLDLDLIKIIRRKAAVHVTSILLTILGSVLRRLLLEDNGNEDDLPDYICMANSLPWASHPRDRMCNEWTIGMFKIPIKNPNVLDRLRETENDFVGFQNKGIHKIIKLVIMPLASLFPVSLIQKTTEAETQMSTSWAAIVGRSDSKLLGNQVTNIWPFVGFTSERMAVVTISCSHGQKMDITLGINREFVGDASRVNRIANDIFPKELEALITAVN